MKFIIIIIILSHQTLYSQGYCSLRNPQAKIKALYPECHFYKTVIATIDEKARKDINQIIPFPIHYYEMGRHNLYLIEDNKTIGLIHARSEESKWGLIEIVWSLNLDLTIRDFSFQRCRSYSKNEVLTDHFKKNLIGKNFYELIASLKKGEMNSLKLSENGHALAHILIRSALKTIALTDLCWNQELNQLRQKRFAQKQSNGENNLYISSNQGVFYFHQKSGGKTLFCGSYNQGRFSSMYVPISSRLNLEKIAHYKKSILEKIQDLK